VGMSEANDLAVAEAEPPKAAKRKQICYVSLIFATLATIIEAFRLLVYNRKDIKILCTTIYIDIFNIFDSINNNCGNWQ
jgi:hypothetical protein